MSYIIVKGDYRPILAQLTEDDATFVIDAADTVKAVLTANNRPISSVVTCASTDANAAWATSLVAVILTSAITSALPVISDAGLEIEVTRTVGQPLTWKFSDFDIQQGNIS